VAAVRRAWAAGQEVVVASPRPSAAPLVIPVAGAEVGRALARLRRPPAGRGAGVSPGRPSSAGAASGAGAFEEVVVCLEPGWPLGRGHRPVRGRPLNQQELERAARSLADALSGFERAELVVTGELGVPDDVLAFLWPSVDRVTAGSEDVAIGLRRAGAPAVTVVEPYSGAGLPIPGLPIPGLPIPGMPIPGLAVPGHGWPSSVSPLEPADWLLVARGRRLIGGMARKVLGPRAPAVRAYLLRAWTGARKSLSRLR
jgi:hypothetical protein